MRRLLAGIFFLWLLVVPSAALAEPTGFVERIGFGSYFRPNCHIPMLVNVTADKSGTYQIRVVQEDMDRDEEIFTQTVTLTASGDGSKGNQQKFWLYFIPQPTEGGLPDTTRGGNLHDLQQALKVFLCDEKGKQITLLPLSSQGSGAGTIQNIESIPSGPFQAPRGVRFILAVGDTARQPVWRDYQQAIGTMEDVVFVSAHSFELPEDVRGYEMIDGMVWLDAAAPDPAKPAEEKRYHALREWVQSGGHLVICQPPQREATAPFEDLLPVTIGQVVPKGDLEPLKTLATEKRRAQLDRDRQSGRTRTPTAGDRTPFDDNPDEEQLGPGVSDWDTPKGPFMFARATLKPGAIADTLIKWKPDGSDNTPYIARIGYGAGAVTWVADDLSDPAITSRAKSGWPYVWDRVLDYKHDLTIVNVRTLEDVKKPYLPGPAVDIGRSLLAGMELTSKSRALVSIAVVFFIAYWVLAGPGVYLYLLTKSRPQLSWFLFAFSAVVATVMTVLVVKLVVRGAPELAHVTLVRGPAGEQPLALSRFGLYIPRDGSQELKLPDVEPKKVSYLTGYPEHPSHAAGDVDFPAQLPYVIPLRDATSDDPVVIDVPYRSTLKKFQVRRWGAAGGAAEGAPKLRVVNEMVVLEGNVLNNTGRRLKNVYFVYHDPAIDDDQIFFLPAWEKSQTLKLEDEFSRKKAKFIGLRSDPGTISGYPEQKITLRGVMGRPGVENGWSRYWYGSDFRSNGLGAASLEDLDREVPKSYPMMSLFERLPPMRNVTGQSADRVELLRRGGRYLDVSPAVSAGRLVVLAQADGQSELPFPLEVDGDKVAGRGTTVYQFILPLEHLAGTEAPTTQPSEEVLNQQQPPAPPHEAAFDPTTYSGDGSDLTPQQRQDWFMYRRNPGAYRRMQQMRLRQQQQQQQKSQPGPGSSAQPVDPRGSNNNKKTAIATAAPLNVEAATWPQ